MSRMFTMNEAVGKSLLIGLLLISKVEPDASDRRIIVFAVLDFRYASLINNHFHQGARGSEVSSRRLLREARRTVSPTEGLL